MQDGSTIAAIATARGEGGIAIVRVSGPRARAILEGAFAPASGEISDRRLTYGRVVDAAGAVIDEAMAVFLPAPRTYTREDVAELQCHGGSVAARRTLARVLELGARPAEPGEFTKRAFLNGRIDLSRAEAVMQLVGANSEAAARASVRQLEGGVSGFVREISARILDLLSLIEASTDFPEEIDEFRRRGTGLRGRARDPLRASPPGGSPCRAPAARGGEHRARRAAERRQIVADERAAQRRARHRDASAGHDARRADRADLHWRRRRRAVRYGRPARDGRPR